MEIINHHFSATVSAFAARKRLWGGQTINPDVPTPKVAVQDNSGSSRTAVSNKKPSNRVSVTNEPRTNAPSEMPGNEARTIQTMAIDASHALAPERVVPHAPM